MLRGSTSTPVIMILIDVRFITSLQLALHTFQSYSERSEGDIKYYDYYNLTVYYSCAHLGHFETV